MKMILKISVAGLLCLLSLFSYAPPFKPRSIPQHVENLNRQVEKLLKQTAQNKKQIDQIKKMSGCYKNDKWFANGMSFNNLTCAQAKWTKPIKAIQPARLK